MNRPLAAFASTLALVPALAFSGTGMKNGGTLFRCGEDAPVVAEYILAKRMRLTTPISDRNAFFAFVEERIPDENYRRLLRDRWERFGDSETWPTGSAKDAEVYYYVTTGELTRYPADGVIPARGGASICEYPAYDPEGCCDHLLVSYFDEESAKPTKIEAAYRRLDRYQKNLLELHEAMYRTSYDLGRMALPSAHPDRRAEFLADFEAAGSPTAMPANLVYEFGYQLLPRIPRAPDIEFSLDRFWIWSHLVHSR